MPIVPYLLNLIYLTLLCALSPYLLWAAVRKGKYRTGYSQVHSATGVR